MPHYRLTYFQLRGRAETARYIFAYHGIKYEDNRIEWSDWPNIKPTLTFRQVPILEVDGVVINQSAAIARYLARETGLAGNTNLEQAQVDAIADTINDFMNLFPWTEKDQTLKQKMIEDVFINNSNLYLDGIENLLGDKMWFVGDSVTWADFHWAVCSITLTNLKADVLCSHPKLLSLKERVEELPSIAIWIKQRPNTVF
eukprot:gi/632968742/ref/XP_007900695.1/ PREDICTED: hematopoietic prostaglandin D synthase isoform X2 [Callorhinchus milii]